MTDVLPSHVGLKLDLMSALRSLDGNNANNPFFSLARPPDLW